MYERLGFVIVSGRMSATKVASTKVASTKTKSKQGEWKKRFHFPRDWQKKESKGAGSYDAGASGYALVTGAKSGVTAIDVDDPEAPNNKKLMGLMADCTLVARTKRGFHYVYKYDGRILQTTGDKLDTRNDGGCIFVAPSVAYDDEGRTVAEYEWVRVPGTDESLVAIPESVIDFLRALDRGSGSRYVAAAPAPNLAPNLAPTVTLAPNGPTVPTVPTASAPTVPTVTLAPNGPTAPMKHKQKGPTVPMTSLRQVRTARTGEVSVMP